MEGKDLRVKKLTQVHYLCIFCRCCTRGESEVKRAQRRGRIRRRRVRGRIRRRSRKSSKEKKRKRRRKRRRVRADLRDVSSFYRHSWKVP